MALNSLSSPVEVREGRAIVNPKRMRTGLPYQYVMFGKTYAAIKRKDESVDFYEVPRQDPEAVARALKE